MSEPRTPLPDPSPKKRRIPGSPLTKDISLDLKTITPILGGAPQTRTVDAEEPIRVSSIRGALRFWWRALYGSGLSPNDLAQKEAALWGRAGNNDEEQGGRSTVDISLQSFQSSGVDTDDISSPDAYALWPARGNRTRGMDTAPRLKPALSFTLHLRVPQDKYDQLVHSLRAWILFGGYGSRTRRGCGSLSVISSGVSDASLRLPTSLSRDELKHLFRNTSLFEPRGLKTANNMPILQDASLFYADTPLLKNALDAWHKALSWLRDFRQGKDIARERGSGNRPGRSYWPEPDKIRYLVGQRPYAHTPRPEYGSSAVWPRASFGLPIVGQFQQIDRSNRYYAQGDPRTYEPDAFELVWQDNQKNIYERLASPLILKPLALANGSFIPIALWLHRAYPQYAQVVLRQRGHMIDDSGAPFDALSAHNEGTAFAPLRGKQGMRQAFSDWLKSKCGLKELVIK